jgi:hypothetical protein
MTNGAYRLALYYCDMVCNIAQLNAPENMKNLCDLKETFIYCSHIKMPYSLCVGTLKSNNNLTNLFGPLGHSTHPPNHPPNPAWWSTKKFSTSIFGHQF